MCWLLLLSQLVPHLSLAAERSVWGMLMGGVGVRWSSHPDQDPKVAFRHFGPCSTLAHGATANPIFFTVKIVAFLPLLPHTQTHCMPGVFNQVFDLCFQKGASKAWMAAQGMPDPNVSGGFAFQVLSYKEGPTNLSSVDTTSTQ